MAYKLALGAFALAFSFGGSGRAAPMLLPPFPELRVTQFASGLNFPTSMTILSDGALLAGTTLPSGQAGFGNYYLGSGVLMRFTDSANSGVADGPGTVVAAGLPGAITSVRQVGGLVAVATEGNQTAGGLEASLISPSSSPAPRPLPLMRTWAPCGSYFLPSTPPSM